MMKMLWIFRGIVLVLLIIVAMRPVVLRPDPGLPTKWAVLLDNSRSMKVKDPSSRFAKAKGLAKKILDRFSSFQVFSYSEKVEEKDEKKFYNMLERLRKEITGNRDYFFGKGKKAGPIWLGYRTLSSDTEGDFRLIIYKKGAWVLHMLRSMYLDLETKSDERFRDLLRGFYRKYFDQKASTEDFQKYAEAFLGEDLDWFFRQWVYGMDVPEYKFNYEIIDCI